MEWGHSFFDNQWDPYPWTSYDLANYQDNGEMIPQPMGFLFLLLPTPNLESSTGLHLTHRCLLNQCLVSPHARLRQTSRKGGIFVVEEVSQPEAETREGSWLMVAPADVQDMLWHAARSVLKCVQVYSAIGYSYILHQKIIPLFQLNAWWPLVLVALKTLPVPRPPIAIWW